MPDINLNHDGEFDLDVAVTLSDPLPDKSKRKNTHRRPFLSHLGWSGKIILILLFQFLCMLIPIATLFIAVLAQSSFGGSNSTEWQIGLALAIGGLGFLWLGFRVQRWLWWNLYPIPRAMQEERTRNAKR
jgi:hypothetical protein